MLKTKLNTSFILGELTLSSIKVPCRVKNFIFVADEDFLKVHRLPIRAYSEQELEVMCITLQKYVLYICKVDVLQITSISRKLPNGMYYVIFYVELARPCRTKRFIDYNFPEILCITLGLVNGRIFNVSYYKKQVEIYLNACPLAKHKQLFMPQKHN